MWSGDPSTSTRGADWAATKRTGTRWELWTGSYPEQFFPGARRFDAGGKPNPLIVPMEREALQLLTLKLSPQAIQSYLMSLTDSISTQLETLLGSSVVVIKPKSLRSGHILGLRLLDPTFGASVLSEVHRRFKELRVHVSVRSGWLRVSPYIYSTPSEASAFVFILVGVTRSIFILRIPTLLHVVPRERSSYKLLLTGSTGWLGQFVYKHFLSTRPTPVRTSPSWCPWSTECSWT
jgi:hypothetical protein